MSSGNSLVGYLMDASVVERSVFAVVAIAAL